MRLPFGYPCSTSSQDPEVPAVRVLRHLSARHQRRAARAHGVSTHGGDDARTPGGSGTPRTHHLGKLTTW